MIIGKKYLIAVLAIVAISTSLINMFQSPSQASKLSVSTNYTPRMSLALNDNPLVKPFESWNRSKHAFPCVSENSSETMGLYYIKIPKTSSWSLGQITNRIAAQEALRQGFENGKYCKTHDPLVEHPCIHMKCGARDKMKSFLWTIIRHPNERAISHYGMHIGFGNWTGSENEFINKLQTNIFFRPNTQIWWMASENIEAPKNKEKDIIINVKDVLEQYNFIGLFERLHESIVVLSMLIGVNIHDVLLKFRPSSVLSRGCTYASTWKQASWLTPNMTSYMKTPQWRKKQEGDFMLYDMVSKKLDRTIELLGKEKVRKNLEIYNRLMFIGSDLSSKAYRKGCGVIFDTPYSNIDDLKNFKQLPEDDVQFVLNSKKIN